MTALELSKDWLRYAQSDLNTAIHMFNDVHPKENEISCYHSHQCAEKSLKAFLVKKQMDPPRTHDLVELFYLCAAEDSNFSSVQPYCVLLNPYGVQTRYPNELAIDESIAAQAIENAQKLYEFCNNVIKN